MIENEIRTLEGRKFLCKAKHPPLIADHNGPAIFKHVNVDDCHTGGIPHVLVCLQQLLDKGTTFSIWWFQMFFNVHPYLDDPI